MSRDGLFMFWYRRGPHRICEARPHNAGLEVMLVLGTTSAAAAAVVSLIGAAGWNRPVIVVGLLLKMEDVVVEMLGRRRGREEKDLEYFLCLDHHLPS